MKAEQVLEQESLKEENWAVALFREKAEMDYWSGLANARDKGIAIGRIEGIGIGRAEAWEEAYQEKLEIARKMKKQGVSAEIIASAFSLTPEELVNI
jgi:predicted transposase/invertase (TIGR01784 family)